MRRGITHTGLDMRNVLALGHLINHRAEQPSVRMIFVPLPEDYPPDLLMLAPNVNARPDKSRRWIIAAVAIREIHENEGELFLDYGRCPKSLGWQVDFLVDFSVALAASEAYVCHTDVACSAHV